MKSPADPVPDPKNIAKQRRTSQKGESGSCKPKKSYASLKEKVIAKDIQFEDLEPSIVSKEIPSEIHKAPCPVSSPLDLSPKKASHTVHHLLRIAPPP